MQKFVTINVYFNLWNRINNFAKKASFYSPILTPNKKFPFPSKTHHTLSFKTFRAQHFFARCCRTLDCLPRKSGICKHRVLKGVLAIFLKWKLNILMHLNQIKNSDIKMHNGLALWTLLFNIIKLRCLQKRKSCHTISW